MSSLFFYSLGICLLCLFINVFIFMPFPSFINLLIAYSLFNAGSWNMGKGKADGMGFLRKVVRLPSRSGRARNPPPGYLTMTPHREVEGEVPLEEEGAGECP